MESIQHEPGPRAALIRAAVFAAPALALGAVGSTHPAFLARDTAQHWWVMHLIGLFVFPLVAIALAALMRGRRGVVPVLVVPAAYAFATCYTALDVISGIGAGWVTDKLPPDTLRPQAVTLSFDIGAKLGEVGAWALLVAAVVLTLDAVRRHGPLWAAPALLLVAGAWFLRTEHIFPVGGVLSCVAIGLGTGWLAWLGSRQQAGLGA